jgi:[acyl-carrier-protein] S-malonyltransferase
MRRMFAIVFPGQGSQKPGMGRDLHDQFSEARSVFQRVSEATGTDIARLCFESDEETLRQTQNAQLALFTTGIAAWSALESKLNGLEPAAAAGHSVGEYAALVAAGFLSVEQGARLVQRRGELMAESGSKRPGTMAAVLGLERADLEQICQEASSEGVTVVANDNCPGQLVISGDVGAVERAGKAAQEKGAKRVLPLNVSGAFHSPLMEEPARLMGEALASSPLSPIEREGTGGVGGPMNVYSNVTSQIEHAPEEWGRLLEQQLKSPVRWTESIQTMISAGIGTFVECGSGEVLSGLIRRTDKGVRTLKVNDQASLEEAVRELQAATMEGGR